MKDLVRAYRTHAFAIAALISTSALAQGVGTGLTIDRDAQGRIIVGGGFSTVSGSAPNTMIPANRIARWDPDTIRWSALPGGGLGGGSVLDLAFDPTTGEIFAGGNLSTIVLNDGSTLPIANAARYDTSTDTWSPLAGGFNQEVSLVTIDPDGGVVFGGLFNNAFNNGSPTLVNKIARWNGSAIVPFVSNSNINVAPSNNAGIPGAFDVRSVLRKPGGEAMIAGNFGILSNVSYFPQGECVGFPLAFLHGLAALNGSNFSSPCAQNPETQCSEFLIAGGGQFTGGLINDMILDGNDLYLVGSFRDAGCSFGAPVGSLNGIARLRDGVVEALPDAGTGIVGLSGLGGPFPGVLEARCAEPFLPGTFFVGGAFTNAGGILSNSVAILDAEALTWIPLTDADTGTAGVAGVGGAAGEINDMLYDAENERLYVAGAFAFAGGKDARGVAYFDFLDNTWNPLENRPPFAIDLGIRLGNQFNAGPFIGENFRPSDTNLEQLAETVRESNITHGVDLLVENEDIVPVDFRLVSRALLDGWDFTILRNGEDVTAEVQSRQGLPLTFEPGQREVLKVNLDGNLAAFSLGQLNFIAVVSGPADDRSIVESGGGLLNLPPTIEDRAIFVAQLDCNGNGTIDEDEIIENLTLDENNNGRLDSCEIAADPTLDADMNGRIDSVEEAEIEAGLSTPEFVESLPITGSQFPVLADLDGDGTPEVIFTGVGNDGPALFVATIDKTGSLNAALAAISFGNIMQCGKPVFIDVDCDGIKDVLMPASFEGSKFLAYAPGTGNASMPFGVLEKIQGTETIAQDISLTVIDANDDMKPDVIARQKRDDFGVISENAILYINRGIPDGEELPFLDPVNIDNALPLAVEERLQDLNAIGDDAIDPNLTNAIQVATNFNVFELLSDGEGTFGQPAVDRSGGPTLTEDPEATAHKKRSVFSADLNGDGIPETIRIKSFIENPGDLLETGRDTIEVTFDARDSNGQPIEGAPPVSLNARVQQGEDLYDFINDDVECVDLMFVEASVLNQSESPDFKDIVLTAIVNGRRISATFANLGEGQNFAGNRSPRGFLLSQVFFHNAAPSNLGVTATPVEVLFPDLDGDGRADRVEFDADAGEMRIYRRPSANQPCAGDCDDSGAVDFNDLVSMLFVFGSGSGSPCDCDGSGDVDFNDLVCALFLFGPCP